MIESGAFLEYMRVFNTHYYGTPKSFVEQELDAFARRQLAAAVLGFDAPLAAALARTLAPGFELFEDVLHGGRLPAGNHVSKAGLSGDGVRVHYDVC